MKKKLFIVFILTLAVSTTVIANAGNKNNIVEFISSVYSTRQFTNKPISDDIINQVLKAGHKAPSARNQQPWHFTIVRNKPLIDEIMNNVIDENVLIVISRPKDEQGGMVIDFDCGLATQNMFLAAQALGVGARIYYMPIRNLNEKLIHKLNVPENYRAVMILRLGYESDSVDATTAASPRQPIEQKINFIK